MVAQLIPTATWLIRGFIRMGLVWAIAISVSCSVAARLFVKHLLNRLNPNKIDRILIPPPDCVEDNRFGNHRYVVLKNKIRLHYVEAGDPTKTLILFVHGFPEFWYSWRHQLREFSKDYRAVAVDLRGYGRSDKPKDVGAYHAKHVVNDLKLLIEHLNPTPIVDSKKCILVCHDWGALIGYEFLATYPEMVYKYVMMGAPTAEVYYELLSSTDQFKKSWYVFFFQMPILPEMSMADDDYAVFKLMLGGKFNDNFTEEDLEAYKFVFSRPGAFTSAINYYRANLSYFPKNERKRAIGDGENGMFVMGQLDKYISQESVILMSQYYPKLRVEVALNANHFLQQDAPQAVNDIIRDFLGKVPVATPQQ